MEGRFPRIAVALLFAALLAAPVVYRRVADRKTVPSPTKDSAALIGRYGCSFRESSRESGIIFNHTSPILDAKLGHIMPQVASMGAAVSVVDFDRDGWPDIYVTNSGEGSRNALYRNLGDGTFRDVAAEVGLADVNLAGTGVSTGAVWGDYDNDGYEDVFIYKWGRPELFHNDGGKHFTRVTRAGRAAASGSTRIRRSGSTTIATESSICSWADITPKTSTSGI